MEFQLEAAGFKSAKYELKVFEKPRIPEYEHQLRFS